MLHILELIQKNTICSFANQGKSQAEGGSEGGAEGGAARPASAATAQGVGAPAGLSEVAFKRVTGENPPTPEQLEKVGLIT